jgi:uncharacterized membrane protein
MDPLHAMRPEPTARHPSEIDAASFSVGDRVADAVARFGGSWTFILLFLTFLALWIGANSLIILLGPFDPYPFIFLNLLLSCVAALQAPIIMMSQNRQAVRDRLAAEHDYEVNVEAEQRIEALHRKVDVLREEQWAELVRMQQRQIGLLERLLAGRGRPGGDAPPPESRLDGAVTAGRRRGRRPLATG